MTPSQIIQAYNPVMFADDGLNVFISMAENTTGRGFFKGTINDNGDLAVALKALHMWTLARTRSLGESGAVNGKQEGQLRVGYGNTGQQTGATDDLDQTHWGKQLLNLMKQQGTPMSAIYDNTSNEEQPTIPENLPPITEF